MSLLSPRNYYLIDIKWFAYIVVCTKGISLQIDRTVYRKPYKPYT